MASKYQNKIKAEMKARGYRVLNVIRLGDNGFPDLQCLKDGKTVWVECKEANDTLKPLQRKRIDELRALGFEAYCMQDGKGKIY